MQPRLKNSKKWTALPKELVGQIQSIFSQNFREHIAGKEVQADGRIYPEEILIHVSIKPKNTLKQAGWDVSIAYKRDKDNVLKLLHLAVDAIGSLFEQQFTAESDEEFPRIWQQVDFEGRPIFIQYTTVNTELEAQADAILGLKEGEDMVGGDWEDETSAEQIKASLGIDPDEDFTDEEEEKPAKPGRKH